VIAAAVGPAVVVSVGFDLFVFDQAAAAFELAAADVVAPGYLRALRLAG
jgi:hypothetical protein